MTKQLITQLRKTKILIAIIVYLQTSGALASTKEALHAIHSQNIQALSTLLEQDFDPNTLTADGSSLLAWAAESQNADMVQLLLSYGADPNSTNNKDLVFSPLTVACHLGASDIVSALIKAGANVNVRASHGVSALALCAAYSSLASVEALMQQGATVNTADSKGQTPLMWAASQGRTETIKHLLARGAKLNQKSAGGFTALFFALKSATPDAAHFLLDAGADAKHVLSDGTTAVKLAMYQKQYEIVARLAKQRVDLEAYDRNGNQLLHAAVLANQPALVTQLLKKGANPNALTGKSEITWRYEVNFTSAPYVVYAKTPLLLAAENGYAQVLQQLVSAGADTTFRAEDGTNVVLAAARSNPETLKVALTLDANANITNKSGRTPLHLLLSLGTENPITDSDIANMFKLLADNGARIDIADNTGTTAAAVAQADQYRSKSDFNLIFNRNNEVNL